MSRYDRPAVRLAGFGVALALVLGAGAGLGAATAASTPDVAPASAGPHAESAPAHGH